MKKYNINPIDENINCLSTIDSLGVFSVALLTEKKPIIISNKYTINTINSICFILSRESLDFNKDN
ncbi:hypothetical protein OSSY52_14110 [Tepiditoga spiralis]|uniref:Uncharacterized protein n=1 Tax=Tepiditoga spiralis TaxID=2108365 RepID=A0A7G1G458_9BACT|nr:hypothetical protein OSSY52_14110 [Tepiditoga spiralis]